MNNILYLFLAICALLFIYGNIIGTIEKFQTATSFCNDCNSKNINNCINCNQCGYCVNGLNSKCVKGDVYGPYDKKEKCNAWYYADSYSLLLDNNRHMIERPYYDK